MIPKNFFVEDNSIKRAYFLYIFRGFLKTLSSGLFLDLKYIRISTSRSSKDEINPDATAVKKMPSIDLSGVKISS